MTELWETLYTAGNPLKIWSGPIVTAILCHIIAQVQSNPCRLLAHKLALGKGFLPAFWVSLQIIIPPMPTHIYYQRLVLQHLELHYQVTQSHPTPSTIAMMRYDAEKLSNGMTLKSFMEGRVLCMTVKPMTFSSKWCATGCCNTIITAVSACFALCLMSS
jgi:hypothetical protein